MRAFSSCHPFTFVHSDNHVDDVNEIAKVVEEDPADGEQVVQLPEDGPPDDEDQVVHNSQVYDGKPLRNRHSLGFLNLKGALITL